MSDAPGPPAEGSPLSDPNPYGQPPVYGVPPSGPAPSAPTSAPAPSGQVPYHHNPYGTPAYGVPGYGAPLRDPNVRPGTVLAAGIVTLVMSGLVLLLLLVVLFFLLAARSDFIQGFGDQAGLSSTDLAGADTTVYRVILVALLIFIVWCLAAVVLAVLTLRRSNAARIALVVSSSVTALVSLLAITGGASAVTLGAAIAVIVCLFTGGAGDWFHREHLYSPPKLPPV